ncbi:acyltransferase family protein [Actinophytocola xanthii]|uniref:Acyltransferase 3 domain-containing protein n=1 Tax=Actinophytocola xanthii TaxID=1912961 RepID=A0A1Q8CVF9_9PSEU|nr:acyltransferase [Actinophytocola xanthii]OLF18341.1 hypothetical protein BU204_07320 [Actinophytocola xanthii]
MAEDRLVGAELVPVRRRAVFLDIARALAALSVVYTHIYEVFIRAHMDAHTLPTDVLDNAIFIPLKLTEEQGVGNLAVPVFFLISGFVITPLALRMSAGTFAIHRLFRIYPLLLVVVAASAVMFANGISPLGSKPQEVTPYTVLTNATMWNFIDRPFGAWVGVAWTLAVEMLFYALLVIVLPLLRTRMWLAIAVQLELVLVLLITHRAFGDEYRAFVINMTFLLIPVMGQAIWAASTKRIPGWLAALYVMVAWLMFIWARELRIDPNYIPRPYPVALAVLLFLIGMLAEPHLRERRVWTALSERTFSIYLVHGAVAFPLMHLLYMRTPLWLAVLTSLAGTVVVVELSYRFIELPTHNLARRLSGRPKVAPSGRTEPAPEVPAVPPVGAVRPADEPTERTPPVARPLPAGEATQKLNPVARPLDPRPGPAAQDAAMPHRREDDPPPAPPEHLPRPARAHRRGEQPLPRPTDPHENGRGLPTPPAPRLRADQPPATNGTHPWPPDPAPTDPAPTDRRRPTTTSGGINHPNPSSSVGTTTSRIGPSENGHPAHTSPHPSAGATTNQGGPIGGGHRQPPTATEDTGHPNQPAPSGANGNGRHHSPGDGHSSPEHQAGTPASGAGRRRADSSVHAAWFVAAPPQGRPGRAGTSDGTGTVGWPGEQDDPDQARSGGRHRSD